MQKTGGVFHPAGGSCVYFYLITGYRIPITLQRSISILSKPESRGWNKRPQMHPQLAGTMATVDSTEPSENPE
jgi:hypothetical protein